MSKENLYTPGCIRTFTGKYINPCKPDQELICIEDIAHALSMQPRFGGHLPVFYSVAQHCVLTSMRLKNKLKLDGLLHDASEAYLIDVPRPVKEQLSNYKDIEHRLMGVIAEKFSFQWPLSDEVKEMDERMLKWEWEALMISEVPGIEHWDHQLAKAKFLEQFYKIIEFNKPQTNGQNNAG